MSLYGIHVGWKVLTCIDTMYLFLNHYVFCHGNTMFISESEAPPTKKMKTSSVLVEQAGQSDRLLIDQVTDVDSIFDEVSDNQAVR